jgi:pimeloyl-ACP methyl ester carboxylesterase
MVFQNQNSHPRGWTFTQTGRHSLRAKSERFSVSPSFLDDDCFDDTGHVWFGIGRLVQSPRAREMAAGIRGSHLVAIPDSGHPSKLERPAAVTMALVEWLRC